mmetsp:Transcript_78495/g.163077  ORF Transcript_78495/g.163077 Transcript_78495/m.163077 type:complete len:171 (+) Transcript_78495:79-591(+)
MSQRVVVASGYFDPLHYGHIEFLQKSKDLGDRLIVIVNNDEQTKLKKGQSFMPARERVKLVRSLACVDAAVESVDTDNTVCKTLRLLHPDLFTNGGDQLNENIPEAQVCAELGIAMVDGLGEKIQSSTMLLKGARNLTRTASEEMGDCSKASSKEVASLATAPRAPVVAA